MIFDSALILAGAISAVGAVTGQLVTANSALSTNTLDLGPPGLGGLPGQVGDIGSGEQLKANFTVLVAPLTCTTVQFQLIQADDTSLTSNVQIICQSDAFPIASLPAGTQVPLVVDHVTPYAPKRYMGARIVSTGATVTALSVFGGLLKDTQDTKSMLFKNGFGIL